MKMDPASPSRMAGLGQWPSRFEPALRDALRWWLGELAGAIPASLRRRLASLHSRFVLAVDGTGLRLLRETDRESELLARGDLRMPQTLQRISAAMPSTGRNGRHDVTLRLSAARALRLRATLPLAAERNLVQVVGFEFERLVPFRRDAAHYAYRIVARDKAARGLQIELTVVPRAEIDAVVQAGTEAGIHVAALEIPGTDPADVPSIIPLEKTTGTAPSHVRLLIGALVAMLLILAGAAIAIPFVQAENDLDRLTVALAAARRDADLSARLQKQIEARRQDQHFLIDRRLRLPTVTELLDSVTRLAPDDTWLTEFQITGSELRLTGVANSATALLGLIDQSPGFRNAAFRSPVVQDAKQGKERFDIAADIAPRGTK